MRGGVEVDEVDEEELDLDSCLFLDLVSSFCLDVVAAAAEVAASLAACIIMSHSRILYSISFLTNKTDLILCESNSKSSHILLRLDSNSCLMVSYDFIKDINCSGLLIWRDNCCVKYV